MFSWFINIIIIVIIKTVIFNIVTLIVINSRIILIYEYLAIILWVPLIKSFECFSFISAGSESRKYRIQKATLMIIIQ
jgi:hypothetical protein